MVSFQVIRDGRLLDRIAETTVWVDREQVESFMHEYKHSSDKEQFLKDRTERLVAIRTVCLISFKKTLL